MRRREPVVPCSDTPRDARPALVLLTVSVVTVTGCRVFDEGLLAGDAGRADAGVADAGVADAGDGGTGSSDGGPACPLVHAPPRPGVADGPSVPDVVFALEGIDLDQRYDEWVAIGYDLDGICSVAPEPEVECYAPAASSVPEIDGEGGIDNAFGHQVLPIFLVARPDLASSALRDQHVGVSTFVLRIRDWNGTRDDPRVDAMLATSEYGTPGLPDGGAPDPMLPDGGVPIYGDGGVPTPPRWAGNDYWWLRAESFSGGSLDSPRMHDDQAWIAGGVLVMRLAGREPIVLTGGYRATIFRFTEGVLTAQLSADFMRIDRAVVAGRWPIADILDAAPHTAICPGTMEYASLARVLDLTADIRTTAGTGGPTATCDALSVGFTLRGTRAKIGGISGVWGTPNPCGDGGVPDGG